MLRDRPSFSFGQHDNLRRYKDAAAILVASLDLGAPNQYRAPRDTYWDSTGWTEGKPMKMISISNAMADRFVGRRLGSVEVGVIDGQLSGQDDYVIGQTDAPAYNVVGIIRGTDAKVRNSFCRDRDAPRSHWHGSPGRSRFNSRVQLGRARSWCG